MMKVCSTASSPKTWLKLTPSARSSANSVVRSRAATAALTRKPSTAKTSAAAKPRISAPCRPLASGSSWSCVVSPARETIVWSHSRCLVISASARGPSVASHHSVA